MPDLLGFLSQAKSWWRNKQRERREALRVERKYVVQTDEDSISVSHPNGDVQVVAWDAIQTIAIHTNDGGPYVPDFWWVLDAGATHCTWPQGATGEEEARDRLFKRFPDVNNETLLFAYGSTENARFVCWKRNGGA